MPQHEINILIIEDDHVDQMAFTRIIGKSIAAVKFSLAETIASARVLMDNNLYNWVISDYNLPDGTVVDILSYAKQNKMICVSGETEAARIKHLLDAGCKHFLIKDQSLNYLKKIILLIDETKESSPSNARIDSAVFSLDALRRQFGQDNAIIKDILQLFLIKGSQDIEALNAAVHSKDPKNSQHLAHKMKSSFRVLGIQAAIDILEKIETACRSNILDWPSMQKEVNDVKSIYSSTQSSIPALLQKLTTDG